MKKFPPVGELNTNAHVLEGLRVMVVVDDKFWVVVKETTGNPFSELETYVGRAPLCMDRPLLLLSAHAVMLLPDRDTWAESAASNQSAKLDNCGGVNAVVRGGISNERIELGMFVLTVRPHLRARYFSTC